MCSNQLPADIKSQQAVNLTKDLMIISLWFQPPPITKLAPSKQNSKNVKFKNWEVIWQFREVIWRFKGVMWQFENVICTGVGARDAFASKNYLVDFVWLFSSGKLCNLQYLRNSTSGDRSQEQKISACKNQIAVSPSFDWEFFRWTIPYFNGSKKAWSALQCIVWLECQHNQQSALSA